uniref:Uncharacterized protein n=1 Tax=Cyclospora cayetanensis TaxID=88456 RepID=A0A0K0NU00_9EIME|nr:hypothetical protein [Cyclospora cayetanensis]AKO71998.1 hypothetical protein [Cyclospora cayetanensis]
MISKIFYITSKNIKIIKNNNIFPILITNNICIYTYFKYIKLIKSILSQYNLNYIESYNIYIKQNKKFNLINTYFPKLYLIDNIFYKIICIKYNFSKLNYLFIKNILLPKNLITQLIHKQFINNYITFLLNNKSLIKNSVKIYSLYINYIYLTTYYTYWKNLFSYKYIFNFLKGIYLYKKNISNFNESIKDITSGLISIEIIFEAKALPNIYLIPSKLSILNNLFISYEETTLNYLWKYNLYTFSNKNLLFFTEINTISLNKIYEHNTAILLPNNIITSGNYSINILLLKLFSYNLNFYKQDHSIIMSHIFIFNLIIESLLKQYFKNGINIPSIQFELIAKKMTSFVKINYIGDSSLLENDIFEYTKLKILNYTLFTLGYKQILYIPIILGITKSILACSGFFLSISFQEIIKYLIKLSIEVSTDWLSDLKSNIITTDIIKTGSGWQRHFIKI